MVVYQTAAFLCCFKVSLAALPLLFQSTPLWEKYQENTLLKKTYFSISQSYMFQWATIIRDHITHEQIFLTICFHVIPDDNGPLKHIGSLSNKHYCFNNALCWYFLWDFRTQSQCVTQPIQVLTFAESPCILCTTVMYIFMMVWV